MDFDEKYEHKFRHAIFGALMRKILSNNFAKLLGKTYLMPLG